MLISILILKTVDSTKKVNKFSSQFSLQAFKGYICIYKKQREHPIKENQQRVSSFSQNKPFERVNEEICCISNKEKAAKNEWENDDSDFL